MIWRMLASVLPRQSVSPAISWSIRSDGFIGSLCLRILVPFSCESSYCRSVLLGRSLRKKSSNDMAFPHPQSRKNKHRNEDKPSGGGGGLSLCEKRINGTDEWKAKEQRESREKPTWSRVGVGLFGGGATP